MARNTFQIIPAGNLANQMIQYMVALKFCSLISDCTITNVTLPDWGIICPHAPSSDKKTVVDAPHHFDFCSIAKKMMCGEIDQVEYIAHGQRLENFLPADIYRGVFPARPDLAGGGESDLTINIRGGDILAPINRSYTLLPASYYKYIIDNTGLRPIFMGQIDDNIYIEYLRHMFPKAMFLPSGGPLADFNFIRNSVNIVISVSTFSWLAAWLSGASRIFMPISGFYNPMQEKLVDLVPLDDRRYRFSLFPLNYSVPVSEFRSTHLMFERLWRPVTPYMLRDMWQKAPRFPRDFSKYCQAFDEAWYVKSNPDVLAAVTSGHFASGAEHYKLYGFEEHRSCVHIDPVSYCNEHPIAAFQVSQGDFLDLEHHLTELGLQSLSLRADKV